jgi:phospholipid/cholesterol/gamma-HCH transport system substrate-binding protein
MAQRKQMTWTELRVGVFVLVGLFLIAITIFYVTGGGTGFLSPKYTLKTYLPEVEGLVSGAPVRLDGVEIGNVDQIRLNPHSTNRMNNIELVMRINKRFQDQIRTDSTATLITEGLLGNRYVSITRGQTGQVVQNEGVVPGTEEAAIKEIVERGAEVAQNLSALSQQLGEIVGKVQKGQGTIGKLLTDESLYNNLNSAVTRVNSVVASVQAGEGTVGKLLTSDELYNKANATIGHAETLLADVREQKGTLGKLIYDPSVYTDAKQFLEHGNTVVSDIEAGKGTLGKLATDEALYANLRDASANVKTAAEKLNSNEGTMGKFFSDPQFYDNVSGLAGDMRLLIGDFRKDPKKFLHVKFSIF